MNSENLVGFGPVADFDFDGVAISVDGADWYEIQDPRSLRSDRFTAYDLDLNERRGDTFEFVGQWRLGARRHDRGE